MKPVVFFLVLFLSGCASQNNSQVSQNNSNAPQKKQVVKTKIELPVEDNNTQPIPKNTEQPIVDADIENTSSAIGTQGEAPLTSNADINKKETYLCTYDSIYKVYAASSVETKGGKLLVSFDEGNMIIESQSAEIPGTYILKLRIKTNLQIFARTKSKQFIYNTNSHTFVFNTGIGPSGFNISQGGHTGRQMRASGTCART